MQRAHLLLLSAVIFFFCCSMSQCREDKTPGPVTTVRGFVHEAKTGIPMGNVQLQIVKTYTRFLETEGVSFYDITTTAADGSYDLKFTPLGKGKFFLRILNPPIYYVGGRQFRAPNYPDNGLILGRTDTLMFTLTKLIGVNVHLTNKSTQDRTAFHAYILDDSNFFNVSYSDGGFARVIVDTSITYHIPQLGYYTYQSIFFNPITSGPDIGGYGDSLSFKRNFYLGKADTSILIVNP
jgi:hypothetical protein